ncbi:MAG: sensor histidine kinase [Planctomycetota bacterium]
MSLAWRILLFVLLLNVLTVGAVQIVVHQAQQRWFEGERELLMSSVKQSFTEIERVYTPASLTGANSDPLSKVAVCRRLLRNRSLRELYDDVLVTSGRPPFDGFYLNTLGAVHRDPERFDLQKIFAGIERAQSVDGTFRVEGGYCRALRFQGRVVGYLWFVPKFRPELPTTLPLWTALSAVLAATLVSAFVLFWLIRRTVGRPMQQVGAAAQAVADGNYDVRLAERGVPELAPLVRSFNQMTARVENHTQTLEQAVQQAVAATEQKERALVLSSRLATIGTLAAGVAHEINNPIGGMQNAVQRLLRSDQLEDRQRVYLELVQDGLQRVARTTRRMLEFSPKDAEPQSFDVRAAVRGAYALVEHRAVQGNVAFTLDAPDGLPAVHGDAHEIQQVMLNLLLNSLDALEGRSGRIDVCCRCVRGEVESGGGGGEQQAAGERVVVVVQDDGPGAEPENLVRIFDPFFTKKDRPDASGLGMFISYSIVQNHGGSMRVDSEPGKGFTTTIELPTAGQVSAPDATS